MPTWMKKTLVALITVLTFGLVSPPAALLSGSKHEKSENQNVQKPLEKVAPTFLSYAKEEAEKQAMLKFGTKIAPVISKTFQTTILPKMEEELASFASKHSEEELSYWAISKRPKAGENEKIFHVYDTRTGSDLLRFHVRRDNPPKEGYYFNFHYHSKDDSFVSHRELGEIYWGKNQPPQWLS